MAFDAEAPGAVTRLRLVQCGRTGTFSYWPEEGGQVGGFSTAQAARDDALATYPGVVRWTDAARRA